MDLKSPILRLRLALASLVALVAIGTAGYRWLVPKLETFDAFYMTLITISTVGYGEIGGDLDYGGRLFTSGLIIAGLFLVGFTTGSFLEALVEGHLTGHWERRRLMRQVDKMKDHWILCGYGRIGRLVVEEIREARRGPGVVIVEQKPDLVRECRERGLACLEGDATHDLVLQEAGIERAKGLLSLVASDAGNVFICLTARQLNPELQIIARALEERNHDKLLRAGADKVIAPYQLGGREISQAVLRPTVSSFLEITTRREFQNLELEQIEIGANSMLDGVALKDSKIRTDLNLVVMAVKPREADMVFNPGASTTLKAGDTLIVIGETAHLQTLEGWGREP